MRQDERVKGWFESAAIFPLNIMKVDNLVEY